ncbi:MAG: hypothetical protein DRQ01_05245 [Ignavibacteriae bacterium]|nr:MAG: hypothetical protein DRQ01_05245 [Ignavibacteriota bacterium]
MKKRLTLLDYGKGATQRDGSLYIFEFVLVNSTLIGKPEERSNTTYHKILVFITGRMEASWLWGQPKIDFMKVCYEFAKKELMQKTKDGSIEVSQELEIASTNYYNECPFDSERIKMDREEFTEFEVGEKLMEDKSLLQIATSIIDNRDFINALIKEKQKEKHKEKLFLLTDERDLLQLFRNANSLEEFVFRISALKKLVTNMNEEFLRKITSITDTEVKSISLLENFLQTHSQYEERPIKIIRNINRLRQTYPIHGDSTIGVLEAYKDLGIEYPISSHSEAWNKVLVLYDDALKRILKIIRT